MKITSVLGDERDAGYVYPNGSYSCPFCAGAVLEDWDGCRNPVCEANPATTIEAATERKALHAQREEAAAERERRNEAWRITMDESREADRLARAELRAEAEREGYCVRCILQNPSKRVRHRDPGFHER